MCLLRRKRLSKHKEHTEESNAENDVTSDDHASSAESNAKEPQSSKLPICDMDRLPPIVHCSELQKSAVSDDPGTEKHGIRNDSTSDFRTQRPS